MKRGDVDQLIARCGWLGCRDEEARDAEATIRRALVFRALAGADPRVLIEQTRDRLLSEGRLRLANDRIQILYEGDEIERLKTFAQSALQQIKLEFFASIIGQTNEALAEACEKRVFAVVDFAARVAADTRQGVKAVILEAAFFNELLRLMSDVAEPTVHSARDRIDHFLTELVRLHVAAVHPDAPKRPIAADVRWTRIDKDLRHGVLDGTYRFGPLRLNVLEASPKRWQLRVIDAHALSPRERDLAALARAHGAVGATNGGFALTSEGDAHLSSRFGEPVGLLVSDGEVHYPPQLRRTALLMDETGRVDIWRVNPFGLRIHFRRGQVMAHKVDSEKIRPGEIVLYTREFRGEIPVAPIALTLVDRRVESAAHNAALAVPVNGLGLAIHPGPADASGFLAIEPGDRVDYELPPMRGLGRVTAAMAGGPALVVDGQRDGDLEADGFDGHAPPAALGPRTRAAQNLAGRTAWGVTDEYNLIAVTVDGGDIEQSAGIDLENLARFLRELGCRRAINMGGDGEAQMAIEGRFVDRARDDLVYGGGEPQQRAPISSAILLVGRR